jgi:predicted enzyme involved in methoxymalonyl-ACP biosynthesis
MIDAIVSIIKIFHQVIEDFQNNSLLTNNYRNRYADRFVIDILREISSFDKLDLDSIFSIRDESNSSS